jgi:hypothetical protein
LVAIRDLLGKGSRNRSMTPSLQSPIQLFYLCLRCLPPAKTWLIFFLKEFEGLETEDLFTNAHLGQSKVPPDSL